MSEQDFPVDKIWEEVAIAFCRKIEAELKEEALIEEADWAFEASLHDAAGCPGPQTWEDYIKITKNQK